MSEPPNPSEFLTYPLKFSLSQIPPEWIKVGWADAQFRDQIVYQWIRSVSKLGDFDLVSEQWMMVLPGILDCNEVTELYLQIRQSSGRLELEWRDHFIRLFPLTSGQLPPSEDAVKLRSILEHSIASGENRHLSLILRSVLEIPELIQALPEMAERARMNGASVVANQLMNAYTQRH